MYARFAKCKRKTKSHPFLVCPHNCFTHLLINGLKGCLGQKAIISHDHLFFFLCSPLNLQFPYQLLNEPEQSLQKFNRTEEIILGLAVFVWKQGLDLVRIPVWCCMSLWLLSKGTLSGRACPCLWSSWTYWLGALLIFWFLPLMSVSLGEPPRGHSGWGGI